MDIVYIFREWSENCLELRYSLRSLKNIKHWKVFIIGYKPKWIKNIIHIDAEDPYIIKSLNALHKINIACNDDRISDDFILMNDDFYITEPTEVKYYYQGTMENHLIDKRNRSLHWSYVRNLTKTYTLFQKWMDFSLHAPIIYNKKKFLELQEYYDMKEWYLLRNLYCNHYKIEWEYLEDCKIREIKDIPKILPTFLSNMDNLINTEEFKEFLNNLFPKASKYESNK
jgi:hypothetical protein